MLSVIIPTMWYYSPFFQLLDKVLNLDCVGEVIIINNNVPLTPNHSLLKHEKIIMHESSENLYVNPSWNLGAELARFNHLCFLSDDVDVNINIFQKTDEFLRGENVGMVATLVAEEESEEVYNRLLTDNTISFTWEHEPDNSLRAPPIGIGVIFFIKRCDWEPVSEEVKIFHAEVIHWCRIGRKKKNFMINNCQIYTPHHVTWLKLAELENDTFNRIQHNDDLLIKQMMLTIHK